MNDLTLSFLSILLMGLGATLTSDLWALFLKHAFKMTPSNLCLVGRWLRTMPAGTFTHANIGTAPQKSAECTVGWIAHYLIGILFAIAFLASAGRDWLQHPTLMPAIVCGVVTVLAPFFLMQPALGLGFAASKTSNPAQARLRSLINHVTFGAGLYVSGLLVSWLIQGFS
jgi:hypothetical protein